ncbi:hypothetical protein JCM19235_7150 [Vibrio maritimus]|uniref:Uncharacterized protein n=1 Tax=Vibrio maritimus TaxID=990268 RepID=A0A090S684_9VIBR|nr:hypothetical protein JCM19235_7150 [Vibrio maritimus]
MQTPPYARQPCEIDCYTLQPFSMLNCVDKTRLGTLTDSLMGVIVLI